MIANFVRPRLKQQSEWQTLLGRVSVAIALYVLLSLLSVRSVVSGPSMQPLLETGNVLLVSRTQYLLGMPERGDVAVFYAPRNGQQLVKRVIGLPGETLAIRDGKVFINGKALSEPYVQIPCLAADCQSSIWQLAADEYFLMGDNRTHSNDSRGFGPVSFDRFIGEAVLRYYPFSEFGLITRIGYDE